MKILLIFFLGGLNGGQVPLAFSANVGPALMAIASAEENFLMDSDLISPSNLAREVRQSDGDLVKFEESANPFLRLLQSKSIKNDVTPHLSTAQLNSFTKEAVNLVRTNCDGLDDTNVYQLNDFLTNVVLVDSNLVSGQFDKDDKNDHDHDEVSFSDLLQSMKTCSNKMDTKVVDEKVKQLTHALDGRNTPEVKVDDEPVKETENETQKKTMTDENQKVVEKVKEDEKQKMEKIQENQKEKVQENQNQDKEKVEEKKPESNKVENKTELDHGKPNKKVGEGVPPTTFLSSVLIWIHETYAKVAHFFKSLFHRSSKTNKETTTTTKTIIAGHPRSRRSGTTTGTDVVQNTGNDALLKLAEEGSVPPPSSTDQKSPKAMGKKVVKQILLDMFRIYGHACPGVSESNVDTFKIAAKTLVKFIAKTNQLTAFAGDKNNLDKKLLQTLHQCKRQGTS